MKKIPYLLLIIITLFYINTTVYAEEIYNIENVYDIDNISNINDIKEINIKNMNLDDLSFLNNYKNIDSITIINSTVNINNLDEELINKIVYKNTFIKGDYNSSYKYKVEDTIVNTEYNYNPKYEDEFNRMAKYIYKSGMSDEKTIKKVTLFVLDYMEYNKKTSNNSECYSHYGICSNYTELEAVLLNKLGIYAITINGYTDIKNEKDSSHSWNLVYLNDNWYVIDTMFLDIYDSSDAIEKNLNVEYYMKEITRDFKSNHIAYYNHLNIPTDQLQSRMSILDKLDEIGEYTPTEVVEEETPVDNSFIKKELIIEGLLLFISIILIIITIKDKKKLKEKVTR